MDSIIFALLVMGVIVVSVVKQLKTKAEELEQERQPQQPDEEEYQFPFLMDTPPAQPQAKPPIQAKPSSPHKTEQPKNVSPPPIQTTSEQEFNIHSIDEVRRAIIWSEILNRKY